MVTMAPLRTLGDSPALIQDLGLDRKVFGFGDSWTLQPRFLGMALQRKVFVFGNLPASTAPPPWVARSRTSAFLQPSGPSSPRADFASPFPPFGTAPRAQNR